MTAKKIIVCVPVWNELHNLKKMVPAWKSYADYIIVCDQKSDDGTLEYLRGHDDVVLIENKNDSFDENNRNNRVQLLLDKARSISEDAILLFLDADETLSSNIVGSLEWKSFLNMPRGTTGYFRWIQLWDSVKRYIARGKVGVPVHMPFAFIDDGRKFICEGTMHGPRGPGATDPVRRFYFNEVVNLHFFMTNRDVYRKKQNWYKLYWLINGGRYFHTNRNHRMYDGVGMENTEVSPREWWQGFEERGIDVFSHENPELMHYDTVILQYLRDHRQSKLWLLDIWNQDWAYLRDQAEKKGYPCPPSIEYPPKIISVYNDLMLGGSNYTVGKLFRLIKRKLLP